MKIYATYHHVPNFRVPDIMFKKMLNMEIE